MRRPSARALKRPIAVMGVLAIASVALRPPPPHTGAPTGAAARTVPAPVIPQPTRSPPSAPRAQPRAVAITVARAYARYLANQLPAQALHALTPQARAIARQSGPLLAGLHVAQVRVASLTGGGDSWTARFAIIDARGRQATTAQLILSPARGRWKLAELIPPDVDTLIAPTRSAIPPGGPAAARRAALGFTQSYLDYTYGHVAADHLRDLTPMLRAAIAANPPRVPASIRALRPRIASLALTGHGARWLADANVTDGEDTYQVMSLIGRVNGDWLAVALRSAG
jgi:hypothetical protein